ncbi:MAG TPA: ribosome biogenesis GTP-binding protein YihA/YsxC [Methylococcaceae bacterium]|nr:ribosome biogenesis GTP-binding protein YihA/YsxC [Methylococcaceae bacterium]
MKPNPFYFRASFLKSAPGLADCPPDEGVEVAFAGRSNAGKSSAINLLTRHKNLARASKTPGRTQLLNFFVLDEVRRLVDLPGYGYARVPANVQMAWHRAMDEYFRKRQSLRGVFLLMDIRHPLTEGDWLMIEWCQHGGLGLHIALTKADKLSRGAATNVLHQVRKALREAEIDATAQLFSSLSGAGVEEAHAALDVWLTEGESAPAPCE